MLQRWAFAVLGGNSASSALCAPSHDYPKLGILPNCALVEVKALILLGLCKEKEGYFSSQAEIERRMPMGRKVSVDSNSVAVF